MGRGARPPSATLRRALRRQLQLPEQDVPAAHAPGGAHDDRRWRATRGMPRSSPAPTPPITPTPISTRGADVVVAGEGESRWSRCSTHGWPRRTAPDSSGIDGIAASRRDGRRRSARVARSSATSTRCRSRPGISSTSSATAPTWRAHHGYFSMNMVTTRGCPYHCNWCAKPIWGQRYAMRSPGHVAEEMALVKRTLSARPPLVRRRHLRPAPRLGGRVRRREVEARDARDPVHDPVPRAT